MHTPPHNLFISRTTTAAASALARAVFDLGRRVPGVSGEVAAASAFAQEWAALSGEVSSVDVSMRMYRLHRLSAPTVPGGARGAGTGDIEIIREWSAAFQSEAAPHQPVDDPAGVAERRLAAGELTLWVIDNERVSLAGCSRAVNGVARVGPVFTPPAHRRHGYGAALTASVSRRALHEGAAHVVLYTDVANPTSNSVYRSIGYVVDHDAQQRRFFRNYPPGVR